MPVGRRINETNKKEALNHTNKYKEQRKALWMKLWHSVCSHVGNLYSCKWPKSSESTVICRGPSLVMILSKWNAVADWRRLMGPTDPSEAKFLSPNSLRAQFGENLLKNAFHGSSNATEAMQSIHDIFEEVDPENPKNPQEN